LASGRGLFSKSAKSPFPSSGKLSISVPESTDIVPKSESFEKSLLFPTQQCDFRQRQLIPLQFCASCRLPAFIQQFLLHNPTGQCLVQLMNQRSNFLLIFHKIQQLSSIQSSNGSLKSALSTTTTSSTGSANFKRSARGRSQQRWSGYSENAEGSCKHATTVAELKTAYPVTVKEALFLPQFPVRPASSSTNKILVCHVIFEAAMISMLIVILAFRRRHPCRRGGSVT
jgi:hypothetical protein